MSVDVCIVGAGPVGATLALALAGHELDVVALDARAPAMRSKGDRSLALSHGARLIFERIGIWPSLEEVPGAVTAITAIDVSQAGGFGTTRLRADEQSVPALGYVVSHGALQHELDKALERCGLTTRFGTTVARVDGDPLHATLALEGSDERIRARLAVVADGAGTFVQGMQRVRHDYGQVALVGSLWLDHPHQGVAYERFTPEGPMALLPEGDHYALVWTMRPDRARALLALADDAFLTALARRFGTRVAGFARVESLRTFPLVLERTRPAVAARSLVIGNASQQLHPVAGQGLNLGLRDAWELSQSILAASRDEIGTPSMLARFAMRRAPDRAAGIAFTHGLVRIFGNDIPLVRWPRGLALAALDALPPVKRAFARTMLFGIR
ncbi:MAG TPA: FAD-dependent monooxygenase [Casimicrobiaceae bacterium]|nr:FAD-dependent monooxygenase [Casimicrobiaceae bacterium]